MSIIAYFNEYSKTGLMFLYLCLMARFYFFIIIFLALFSCKEKRKNSEQVVFKEIPVKYAQLFSLSKSNTDFKVKIYNPWDSKLVYDSCLFSLRDTINRIAVLSSAHIGFFNELKSLNKIIALGQKKYIYNEELRERNDLLELGENHTLNVEEVISLNPDILLVSGFEQMSPQLQSINKSGVKVFQMLEWMEKHPLARAEWIRVVGLILGKTKEADEIFSVIERDYLSAKTLAKAKRKKTVLIGSEYKDVWYAPAGNSYMATLLRDAGADYYWSKDISSGSLALNIEEIIDKQSEADIWLNPGMVNSLKAIKGFHHKEFKSYQQGEVYDYMACSRISGANDFWESGAVNPQFILKDYIKILYPQSLPNYQLRFYKKIE